jgi:hypothetical protein
MSRSQLPCKRASIFRSWCLPSLGVALVLATFRVVVPMVSGNPQTRTGWVHGIAFLLIIAMGVLTPLTMALAVRSDPSWRPTALVSLAAAALFVVFLLLPWGNASFLMAVVTLFAWIAMVDARLRAPSAEVYSPPRCGPFVVRLTRTAPAKAWAAGQSQLRRTRDGRRGGWSRH